MRFTFGIITYNHQYFILELLESIKYQILTFGENNEVELIISDDASKDKTVVLASKWIELNQKLFCKAVILDNKKNVGTVENFKRIMQNIHSEHFKVIAGDDVFADNNVFRCMDNENENALITYVPIVLKDGDLTLRTDWFAKHFKHMTKKRSHRYDVVKQELGSYFHTPCTFYRRKLYTDYYEGYPTYLRLFEDDPLWHSILLRNSKARVAFKNDYLVLYRRHDNAVCSINKSSYAKEFASELRKFKKQILKEEKNIFVKMYLLLQIYQPQNRYLNIVNYINLVNKLKWDFQCKYHRECYRNYREMIVRLEKTQEYYKMIKKNVDMVKVAIENS